LRTYLDTSFLMSLYSPDVNSAAAAKAMRRLSGEAVVSTLAELELLNALQLRIFRKEISAGESQASWKLFEADLQSGIYRLAQLNERIFESARRLCQQTTARLGTRTADILHVAAALELGADHLYSFDQQQRRLARSSGLKLS
jgi:predicted nucleic acid-binding protein